MRKRQACEGRTEMKDWDGDDGVAASGTPTGHGPQERGVGVRDWGSDRL